VTLLERLRQTGQALDRELADRHGLRVAAVNDELAPHVAAGRVVSCVIRSPRGKQLAVEYRMSGSFPRLRPGPRSC
jgi:hypothetical protein